MLELLGSDFRRVACVSIKVLILSRKGSFDDEEVVRFCKLMRSLARCYHFVIVGELSSLIRHIRNAVRWLTLQDISTLVSPCRYMDC